MTLHSADRRHFLALGLALPALLAGCGGGGDDAAAYGPLTLDTPGDREETVGGAFTNAAIPRPRRDISYSSSDPRIAMVGAPGEVETLAHGTVTITATESGTDGRTASYQLRVLSPVLNGRLLEAMSVRSNNTGIEYPYTVYLPASYASGNKRYPVIYMTDGQWSKWQYQLLDSKAKEIILVMIYQGPFDRRLIDYYPPGADAYMRFLKQEMVPLIEAAYRTNGDRTFYGSSAGGALGIDLLFNEPVGEPFFKRYMLGDPALFKLTQAEYDKEAARYNASNQLPVTVFMTGTPQGNGPLATAMAARLRARAYGGMTVDLSEYNLDHAVMAGPTFSEAIDRYF
jgi:hypothetical protein